MISSKKNYPRATPTVVTGGLYAFVGTLFLLIAFCSPYWVQSFEKSFSNFKNMGLWQYCFYKFKFPPFQLNHNFHGCHSIFGQEFYVIREWLLPGWLMLIQSFCTISLISAFANLAILSAVVTRYPKEPVLEYEWILSMISFGLSAAISVLLALSLIIFYAMYDSSSWQMYPQLNFLSWSYWFALASMIAFLGATRLLHHEWKRAYEWRRESHNLIMQMHETRPASEPMHPHHHSGYI